MAFRKPLPAALAQSLPVAGITEDRSIAVPEIVGAEITRSGVARSMYQPFLFTSSSERSEEHTSELQSLMRISYAVFCLKKKNKNTKVDFCHTRIHISTVITN